ncbi:hypothetical protein [Streptomyces sp. NPDC006333]|uniref:hypothetical protein n=1 Tax=Streptomyces sp. NPDC006333 TaxID=3156753 RepID=UPI0033B89789
MTENAETPRPESGAFQKSNAVVAETTVAQLIARPVPVRTSGRMEFAARCPECRDWHRHVGLGDKLAPCGAIYRLEFKTKLKGAA